MNNRDATTLSRFAQWHTHHLQSFLTSLGDLFKKPLASLMTLMVIGIAVALPAGLYVLLQNLQDISQHWDNTASISLYLKKDAPNTNVRSFLHEVQNNPSVKKADYISPTQGLRDFQRVTQYGDVLAKLNENPLPGVIVITPIDKKQTPAGLKNLVHLFKNSPLVNIAQMDLAWVQRLYYIITIGKRITYSLAFLFGLGVLLIIGNTIRLTIEHHYDEMMVLKLVGATDTFIRRPILYRGFLYGLFGGVLAWLLVGIMLSWLRPPAQALASSYSESLILHGLPLYSGLVILAFSAALGITGAWLAARHQLRTLS